MTQGDLDEVEFDRLSPEEKAKVLATRAKDLATAVGKLERSRKFSRIATAVISLIGCILIGVVITLAGVIVYVNRQANCTADWANASSNRSQILLSTSTTRTDAIDDVFGTLPNPGDPKAKFEQNEFNKALIAEKAISDAYKQSVRDNPLPPSPRLAC